MHKDTVLSYSVDRDLLRQRETALRGDGFKVISVETETQARFEIEMGRCGVMLMCFRAHPETVEDLTRLFRRNCPGGRIIFVMNHDTQNAPHAVDVIVPESAGPQAIVRALRSGPNSASSASKQAS